MEENQIISLLAQNILPILGAIFLITVVLKGVRIVPQSEKHVVERFGRLHSVLGPGINFIVAVSGCCASPDFGAGTPAAHHEPGRDHR